MNWQPIETAPKDGTVVECWIKGKGSHVMTWIGGEWHIQKRGKKNYTFPLEITGWKPLQAIP